MLDDLALGGLLIAPICSGSFQQLCFITKDRNGQLTRADSLPVRFVPLTDKRSQLANFGDAPPSVPSPPF